MLSQQLNLKLQQKLSPVQIQVIKMLEFPSIELEERIREEMIDNPALELGRENEEQNSTENQEATDENSQQRESADEMEWVWETAGDNDDPTPEYRTYVNNSSVNDKVYQRELSNGIDLHDYLLDQLHTLKLSQREMQVGEYIIGNIDTSGFLRRENENMIDDIAMSLGFVIEEQELERVLAKVQDLEPSGVAAHNLQESLLIQIRHMIDEQNVVDKTLSFAEEIINDMFTHLVKKQYDAIMKRLHITREEMNDTLTLIKRLTPNPGANFGTGAESITQTITPDFIVENNDGEIVVSLNNGNVPELRVSREYNEMVEDYTANTKNQNREMREALQFAKQKVDAARWFIDSIKQRNNTLLQTMKAIVSFQKEYFLNGDDRFLRPMKLKDIADIVEFDVSTISRVSNSKYVDTEWGIIPLKHFFSESMTTTSGEEISNKEIKALLRELVDAEDKSNPIADDMLTDLLNKRGYNIARRTVAKYRKQLNIPVARLRKDFNI